MNDEVLVKQAEKEISSMIKEKEKENSERNSSWTDFPHGTYSLEQVVAKVEEYLPNSATALKIALAVATSGTRSNDVMLWVLFVGAPSSGKTDLVKLLKRHPSIYNLDNLTLNAFISGERPSDSQKVYDLLPNLDKKCLVVKDWTVIFSLDEKMTKKIVGDLVGIYDKSLSKHSSRRGTVTYNSEFSQLGCITPATLNKHNSYLNMIGPRFLSYSMPELSQEEDDKSFTAIFDNDDRKGKETEISEIVCAFLDQLNQKDIDVIKPLSDETKNYLKMAARFMARSRGIVIMQVAKFQDEKGSDITYYEALEVQIEKPWRAVQQLIEFSKYLALVDGKDEVGVEELQIIKIIVVSSMPADRAQAIKVLQKTHNGIITGKELSEQVERSDRTARRLLDELSFLGIVKKDKGSGTVANSYRLVEDFKNFVRMDTAEFMSNNSGPQGVPIQAELI